MAQINLKKIRKIDKQQYNIHSKVSSTYSVFEQNGEKYLQIDTYGREDREMPEKISQTIQFDRETAKYIVNLLVKEFDLK